MKKENTFDFFDQPYKVYVLLIGIPVLLYLKSLWFGFSPLDEQWMILKNGPFLEKWKSVSDAFTIPTAGIYYRPLFTILLITDYHLGQLSPLIYHFSCLLLHLINVILLHRFLLNFETDKRTAFMLALIFSAHPVLLHSIAWIPGSNDLILGATTLSALICFQKYMKEKKRKFLILHVAFFIAALFTKENAIVLPLIFAAMYSIQKPLNKKELWRLGSIWLALTVAWFVLRKTMVDIYPSQGAELFFTIKQFVTGMIVFIGKAVLPIQQSVFPTLKYTSVIPGIIATGLLVLSWFKPGIKNKGYAQLGLIIFFSLLIIPVWFGASNTSGEHYEHRVYTSMAGLMLFVSQLDFKSTKKLSYALMVICVLYGAKTFVRMDVYKDRSTFLEAGLKEAPDYYLFYMQKADLLFEKNQYDDAVNNYTKAIALRPDFVDSYNNRGHIYAAMKKYKEAISDFSGSIAIKPNQEAYLNRCISYSNINDLDNAVKDLLVLKKSYPGTVSPDIERNIIKRWSLRALDKMNRQLATEPENAELYVARAKLYAGSGQREKALSDMQKACSLQPENQLYQKFLEELNK